MIEEMIIDLPLPVGATIRTLSFSDKAFEAESIDAF